MRKIIALIAIMALLLTTIGNVYAIKPQPNPVNPMVSVGQPVKGQVKATSGGQVRTQMLANLRQRVEELRNRYMEAKQKEVMAYNRYMKAKELLQKARRKAIQLSPEQKVNITRDFVIGILDRRIGILERTKAILEERYALNPNATGLQQAISNIEERISYLEEKKQEIEEATTIEEIRSIIQETNQNVRNNNERMLQIRERAVIAKSELVLDRMQNVSDSIREKVEETNNEELIGLLDKYDEELGLAEEKLEEARNALENGNHKEFGIAIRDMAHHIRNAHRYLVELVRKYRQEYSEKLITPSNAQGWQGEKPQAQGNNETVETNETENNNTVNEAE